MLAKQKFLKLLFPIIHLNFLLQPKIRVIFQHLLELKYPEPVLKKIIQESFLIQGFVLEFLLRF